MVLAAAPLVAQPYSAAHRTEEGAACLLEEGLSRIITLTGDASHRQQTQLAPPAGGRRRDWTGFARFRGEWWLADGTPALHVYAADGRWLRRVVAAAPASDLFVARGRLFLYDATPAPTPMRLWYSDDGRAFHRSQAANLVPPTVPPRSLVIAVHVLFASTPDGGFVCAPLVGPPLLTRADRNGANRKQVPLAYSRRIEREKTAGIGRTDVPLEQYSAPVRDLLATPAGEIIVLRNREDVRAANGQVVPEQARRIDRYSHDGKHLGTATFGEKVRWIVSANASGVVAMTADGDIVRAVFAAPQPAQVLATIRAGK